MLYMQSVWFLEKYIVMHFTISHEPTLDGLPPWRASKISNYSKLKKKAVITKTIHYWNNKRNVSVKLNQSTFPLHHLVIWDCEKKQRTFLGTIPKFLESCDEFIAHEGFRRKIKWLTPPPSGDLQTLQMLGKWRLNSCGRMLTTPFNARQSH